MKLNSESLKELICKGKSNKALDCLLRIAKAKELSSYDRLVLISGTLKSLNEDQSAGIITRSEAKIERAKIDTAILYVISEFSTEDFDVELDNDWTVIRHIYKPPLFLIFLIAGGLVTLFIFYLFWHYRLCVNISDPKDGAYVEHKLDVKGYSHGLTSNQSIWTIVYYDNTFFPHEIGTIPIKDSWVSRDVMIGTNQTTELNKFEIYSIILDNNGKLYDDIQKAIANYQGLQNINGYKAIDKISVIRKE